jgi:hypothetical protein
VQVGQVPVPLVEIEAVADEELVGNREPDVPHGEVVDEPAVGAVEQGRGGQRGGIAQPEGLAEVVEGEAGVDDVLDDEHVPAGDLGVEVLEEADACVSPGVRVGSVARELDEVEPVRDPDRPREVGKEDDARLQRRDEERRPPLEVPGDLPAELGDAGRDVLAAEVDLAQAVAGR